MLTYKQYILIRTEVKYNHSSAQAPPAKLVLISYCQPFENWAYYLIFIQKRVSSKSIGVYFNLSFQHAATGFQDVATFNPATFITTQRATITGLSLLAQAAVVDANSSPLVINTKYNARYDVEQQPQRMVDSSLMIEVPAKI